MEDYMSYLSDLEIKLIELEPYKIILFGSYANGTYTEDSDIDILVVLNSDTISQNYEEKMRNRLLVRQRISDISKKVPIDLLVYTKKEYEIIMSNRNSFFDEIAKQGKVLYEAAS